MRNCFQIIVIALGFLSLPAAIAARIDTPYPDKNRPGPQLIRVMDGTTVHNVGELQMHVGN